MRTLIIEDNMELARLLAERLGARGIDSDIAAGIEEADDHMAVGQFDAIMLDLGLPDGDGIDWLRTLPADRPPVLILSARSTLDDRVMGLDTGADDYLVKPAEVEEIAARLRALVRRPGRRDPVILKVGNVTFDPTSRQAEVDGQVLAIGRKEADFLEILLRNAGKVVPRERLEGSLYSASDPVTPNALEAVASRLRRRFADAGEEDILHTVRGVGYFFGTRKSL
ncbi:MAG: response regulator transcription factor [Hyphomonas sp.]|nr:response regulator transcription factor [Hyphomonas sp.]MCB9961603.1 response regulator transcription factor [Hyphomonas sp.]MCB9971160.1 response regulator transcription factor [Hyphomonas sp.]